MDLSETRRFNWRTFLPYMRGTVDAEQWHQVVCSVEKKCPAGLAMAVPFWQPLQTDKLYVWVAIVHKCMCMRYRCMARNLTDSFLYAWIWVKPDGLIEELFYLTWGERLIGAEQWHQVVCSVKKKCPAGLAMAVPFWQTLQADKLYVWVAIVHKCVCAIGAWPEI